jgi:hypothetical protein
LVKEEEGWELLGLTLVFVVEDVLGSLVLDEVVFVLIIFGLTGSEGAEGAAYLLLVHLLVFGVGGNDVDDTDVDG